MNSLEYYDIPGAPLARVYKNLLPNVDKLIDTLRLSEKNPEKYKYFNGWQTWNDLGTMVPVGLQGVSPSDAYDGGKRYFADNEKNIESELLFEVYQAYYVSLDHYVQDKPEVKEIKTFPDGPSFYKYDHTLTAPTFYTPEYSMNYHTDFAFSLKDNPGKKSITTTTMYLNDDYLGGEMVFNLEPRLSRPYYKRSDQFGVDEPYINGRVVYRPEAGDVVVFPSGNPDYLSDDGFYFHCVNRVTHADKYFLSIFNSYEFAGSKEWQEGIEEYGRDLWIWLERKRAYNAGFKKKAVSLDDPSRE
jgi:hypothetical protein